MVQKGIKNLQTPELSLQILFLGWFITIGDSNTNRLRADHQRRPATTWRGLPLYSVQWHRTTSNRRDRPPCAL